MDKLNMPVLNPVANIEGEQNVNNNNKLGQLISWCRKQLRLKSSKLADLIGVSRQYLNVIELGQYLPLKNSKIIERLAGALKLDITELQNACGERRLKRKTKYKTPLSKFFTVQRLKSGLTQEKWGKHLGISLSTVYQMENGRTPRPTTLNKISEVLQCPILRQGL